jgi:hypothetical protein
MVINVTKEEILHQGAEEWQRQERRIRRESCKTGKRENE